jgi:hypothetical protein
MPDKPTVTIPHESATATPDVDEILRYGRHKQNRYWLGIGVLLLGAGSVIAYVEPQRFGRFSYDSIMLVLAFALGGFMTLYALFRVLVPGKPMLLLSPAGLRIHIEWVKDIDIPWREVRDVRTIDIAGRVRGRRLLFPGVTTVVVSRAFYDRHIHVDSWFLRGPGWDMNFIRGDGTVQVALHHEILPTTAEELRAAVEVRWRAFREASPARTAAPHLRGLPVIPGSSPGAGARQ